MTKTNLLYDPNKVAAELSYNADEMAPAFPYEIAQEHEATSASTRDVDSPTETPLAPLVAVVADSVADERKKELINSNGSDNVANVAKVATRALSHAKKPKPSLEQLPLRQNPKNYVRYPVEHLGAFAEVVADLCRVIKVPQAMAGSSVLTTLAFCTQGLANVHMNDGRVVPLSLNCITVGDSGDRKTALDTVVSQRINDIEMEERTRYQRELADYLQAKEAHEQRSKKEQDLFPFAEEQPKDPLMKMENLTVEGLFRALKEGRPSLAVFTDEGGTLFGGPAFQKENALKSITFFSKLWDGSPVDKVRAGEGLNRLYHRRLSMHLMVQPTIARSIFDNEVCQSQGFLPRFLLSWPESLKGTRMYENYNIRQSVHVQNLYNKCDELLRMPLQMDTFSGALSFRTIQLDARAHTLWVANHDNIEKQLSAEGSLRAVAAYASKSAEQAIRIAGVLALAKDSHAQYIDLETMKSAIILARWYLGEALRIANDEGVPQNVVRGETLLAWLDSKEITKFSVRLIMRKGPHSLRQKKFAEEAISVLEEYQQISRGVGKELIDGRETITFWVRNSSE